uniref:Uncharacterized protein n=1 Tax=Kalanchoe fedtschenkoi TaxID=63787 RepID=A0A7N0TRS2_KALFE
MKKKENRTCSISDDSTKNLNSKSNFSDEKLRESMKQGGKTDIMSFTQDLDRRKVVLRNLNRDDAPEGGKESGRKVKKIMRRSTEDKDSSVLLQRLREEIREAVQNKTTKDVGVLLNPKLLAAFRAAVAGPKPDQTQKLSSSALKMKKSLLQKGKVRENLTKKIYATSNGRRKRAWDRDCEIEFWKHRCLKTSKPEKIETLKSVLGLLRSSSDDSETVKLPASNDVNPILSRLYLADTSIFPRKDDIRPVVSLHANKEHLSDRERTSGPSSSITSFVNPLGAELKVEGGSVKTYCPSVNDKPGVNHISSLKGFNTSSVLKPGSQKEMVVQSDIRSDKRKWALEVLARKTAKPGQIITLHEQLEENTLFNGNYPILAQLPVDMRPRPTNIRRNKIPMHIRQTQLYRLTEHLLKQANLPVIGRTAVTELAVADSVNIEKGIAERSNSKLVYLNLCAQELLRHSDCITTDSSSALNSEPILPSADDATEKTNNEAVNDPIVEEALKNTGLLPESPPGSPGIQNHVPNGVDDTSQKMKDDRPDNVLEIISHSERKDPGITPGAFGYAFKYEDHKDMNAQVVATGKVEEESEVRVTVSHLTPVAEKNELNADIIFAPSPESRPRSPGSIKGRTEHTQNSAINLCLKHSHAAEVSDSGGGEEPFNADCEEFDVVDAEPQLLAAGSFACGLATEDGVNRSKKDGGIPVADSEKESANHIATVALSNSSAEACSVGPSKADETIKEEEMKSDICNSVSKKVEAYIKEHVRPLCKSGVITIEQYRWAVAKTTQKVMKYHSKDKNANFLIKEGDKGKGLKIVQSESPRISNDALAIERKASTTEVEVETSLTASEKKSERSDLIQEQSSSSLRQRVKQSGEGNTPLVTSQPRQEIAAKNNPGSLKAVFAGVALFTMICLTIVLGIAGWYSTQ